MLLYMIISFFIVVVWSLSTTCSWIWIICWSFCQRVFFLYFFDSRDSIIIAEVNADEDRILAERFEIAGFPTLKFFPAGAADAPEDYEGGRTAMDLVRYTNEKIGMFYYYNINKQVQRLLSRLLFPMLKFLLLKTSMKSLRILVRLFL